MEDKEKAITRDREIMGEVFQEGEARKTLGVGGGETWRDGGRGGARNQLEKKRRKRRQRKDLEERERSDKIQ